MADIHYLQYKNGKTMEFYIENKKITLNLNMDDNFVIKSHPNNYIVSFENIPSAFKQNQFVIIDSKIKNLYGIHHHKLIEIEAIEKNKVIETCLGISQFLLKNSFTKSDELVVIGGGIVQDIGAFTAKMFKRGVNWIFYPTTLLSMADSCIGGKTALNFENYKNQLALFSSPTRINIDTRFLNTLTKSDIISGMGEILKLFLIGGNYFIDNIDNFTIEEKIKYALQIKKSIIEEDEFESFYRKSLNYGHSFGHAIEPLTNYEISHGESVILGMEIINKLFINDKKISKILSKFSSMDKIKHLNPHDIIYNLKSDKKVSDSTISLIVLEAFGVIKFINQKIDNNLKEKLHGIFTN